MTITVTDVNGNRKTTGQISGSGTANYLVRWSATLAQQNSRIIDGITNGDLTIQKTGTTARAITVQDASYTVAGLELAQTWSAIQTLSAGALNIASNDSANLRLTGSYGGGITLVDSAKSWTIWAQSSGETFVIGSGATGGARAERLYLKDTGELGVGVDPTAGNGLLQLASGTTKVNGIAFGTDVFLHRNAAGELSVNRNSTDGRMVFIPSALEIGVGRTASAAAFIDLTSETGSPDYNLRIIRDPGTNANTSIVNTGTGRIALLPNNASGLEVDNTSTAGQTRLLIYDVDNGTLERVTVGAADSGGTGFKVLRIPN